MNRLFDDAETSPFGLPETAGVYAVCVRKLDKNWAIYGEERIVYIGSSKNIRKRCLLLSHPYRLCYDRFDEYCVYTKSIETDNYINLEKELIKLYRPLLNKNNKK